MPENDSPEPRKGRGNAILTYETISEIDTKLTQVSAKLDYLFERMVARDAEHKDHEVRLRALELAYAGIHASASSNSDVWKWVWAALVSVAMIGLQILNYLK